MTIKIFTFLLVATAIYGCRPSDDYNVNYDGDKLVINGIIEANIGVTVDVSKSQSPGGIIALDGYKVKNPRVWLYQNDSLVGEMTRNAVGKFNINNFKPQVGKYYRLKAVADNLDTAESSPVLSLSPPNIHSFSLKKDSSYAQNKANTATLLSAIIKDNANEKDFYTITSAVNITKDSTFSFYAGIVSNLTSCEFYGYGSVFGIFFNDGCFNGSDYTFAYVSEHNNRGILTIQLSTIDKNYFNYISTIDQPTGFALAFVEPLITSSNIINGYGIFAAKSTRTFSLKLD